MLLPENYCKIKGSLEEHYKSNSEQQDITYEAVLKELGYG